MSRIERFVDFVKGLSPAEKERRETKFLADRFDKIKPHLKALKVTVSNSGVRDHFDDRFVTTIELSFDKKNGDQIRDILENQEIEEIVDDPYTRMGRWAAVGVMVEGGLLKGRFLTHFLKTEKVVIYRGKHANQEDMLRLITLEPTAKVD